MVLRPSTSFLEEDELEEEKEEEEVAEVVNEYEVEEDLEESCMLPTMACMMSMFALLDTAILFVVGSTYRAGEEEKMRESG